MILDVTIDEGGRPAKVEVLREASHGLTEAAVNALRQWLWKPAIPKGRPVAVTLTVTIRFSLGDGGPPPTERDPRWVSPLERRRDKAAGSAGVVPRRLPRCARRPGGR
mgnify:CR=1 FL=1